MSRCHGASSERGSVLMLVPAGVLVLLVLAAITVDAAVAFLGQREVTNAAAAAANDAVTAALSDAAFYADGSIRVDAVRARGVAARAVSARTPRGVAVEGVDVDAADDGVCVTVRGRVALVFSRALPFVPGTADVTGRAGATAVAGERGDAGAVTGGVCR